MYRFDLVRYMNQLDAKKVLLLETGINNTFYGTIACVTRKHVEGSIWSKTNEALNVRFVERGSTHMVFIYVIREGEAMAYHEHRSYF